MSGKIRGNIHTTRSSKSKNTRRAEGNTGQEAVCGENGALGKERGGIVAQHGLLAAGKVGSRNGHVEAGGGSDANVGSGGEGSGKVLPRLCASQRRGRRGGKLINGHGTALCSVGHGA